MACRCGKPTACVQKLSFTEWINHCLHSTGLRVHDLETDLDDGLILLKLLETLSPGKKMPGRLGMLHDLKHFYTANINDYVCIMYKEERVL